MPESSDCPTTTFTKVNMSPNLRLICLATAWLAAAVRAENPPVAEAAGAPVVFVQAGDTIESLAQRHLGTADAADELRAFNQIAAGAQPEPGAPLVLPGAERAAALTALEAADHAMQAASKVEAGAYATERFKRAVSLQDAALQARRAAHYARAQTLAGLAAAEFAHAAEEADQRANVALSLRVLSRHGEVQLHQDSGAEEEAPAAKDRVRTGSRVVTGPGASATLELPGGGVIALGESTVLELARATQDQRSKTTRVVGVLKQGELEALAQSGTDAAPELIIANGGLQILAGRARFWTSRTAEGIFRLSCLENRITLDRQNNPVELAANFGAFAGPGQSVRLPIRLPPSPSFVRPDKLEYATARQNVDLAWELPEYTSPATFQLRQAGSPEALGKGLPIQLGSTPQWTLGVLPAGDHYVMLRAVDGNGLKGPPSAVLKLSITPRTGIQLGPDVVRASRGGRNVVGPGTRFTAVPADADSSVVAFEYSLNGGPFRRDDAGITLGESGEFVISARGITAEGKAGEPVQEILLVDAKAPDLRVHIGEVVDFPGYGFVRSISVLVDDDTKLGKVEFSLNKGPYETYTSPLKLSIEKDFRVSVRAYDAFGNRAESNLALERLSAAPAGVERAAEEPEASPRKRGFRLF
jgi:hypothetical protein